MSSEDTHAAELEQGGRTRVRDRDGRSHIVGVTSAGDYSCFEYVRLGQILPLLLKRIQWHMQAVRHWHVAVKVGGKTAGDSLLVLPNLSSRAVAQKKALEIAMLLEGDDLGCLLLTYPHLVRGRVPW